MPAAELELARTAVQQEREMIEEGEIKEGRQVDPSPHDIHII